MLNAEFMKFFSDHHLGRQFGQGYARGFGNKGNGARSPGVDFQNIDDIMANGILDIHEPRTFNSLARA
jgi:hypothetical protein